MLVDGNGDEDFRQNQRNAQSAVARGNEADLVGAVKTLEEGHDFGTYVAVSMQPKPPW
jgi:hypothetical protein